MGNLEFLGEPIVLFFLSFFFCSFFRSFFFFFGSIRSFQPCNSSPKFGSQITACQGNMAECLKGQETPKAETRLQELPRSAFGDPRTSRNLFKKLKNYSKYVLAIKICKKQHGDNSGNKGKTDSAATPKADSSNMFQEQGMQSPPFFFLFLLGGFATLTIKDSN